MSSSVQIVINNYDYSNLIEYDTVRCDNNVIMTSDTMNFQVVFQVNVDKITNLSNNQQVPATRPRCGQEVIWQNPNVMITAPDGSTKAYREFGGVIIDVKETQEGTMLFYDVSAKSYEHWFNRHLVTAWYSQDAPENIIRKIVSQFCPSFTTYNVATSGTTIIPEYFSYQQPSDAIKSISDQLEYGFYIDYFKDVHFYGAESIVSPLPNNTLNADTDISNGDLIIEENAEQQYNKIFITGFKTRSSNFILLTYTSDGNTTQWDAGYRLSSLAGDVAVAVYPNMSSYLNDKSFQSGGNPSYGVKMTIKRDIVDNSPEQAKLAASNTAYVHYGEHLVRIPNYNGSGNVPNGYIIAVRAFYLKDSVYLASDPQAQITTASLEGTDGIYEFSIQDKSLTNSTMTSVQAKGQLMLAKYGHPQIKGTFNTYFDSTNTQGWRAGQYFTLYSNNRFGGLNEVMFVQRVNKSIVKNDTGGLITLYSIEFADSPYLV